MRLTTKIILGVILSVFFVSLTFIIGFSFTDRKNYRNSYFTDIELPQENITGMKLPTFKTIIINEIPFESESYNFGITNCNISFDSVPANSDAEMLFIPNVLKDFISFDTSNDTLTVKLNLHEICKKHGNGKSKYYTISRVNMHFSISNLDIINNIQTIPVNIINIETDNIKINSHGNINIDFCKAQFINLQLTDHHRSLKVTNSDIKRINLDLDYLNWNIENCNIEEQYITGSGQHHIRQHRGEQSLIKWVPKNKDAELNIKIQGDTTQIVIR